MRTKSSICLSILLILGLIHSSRAQLESGWEMNPQIIAQTPAEWAAYVADSSAADGDVAADSVSTSETEITDKIRAMARALQNDPLRIFNFVRNEVAYLPAYGFRNGAEATLLARRGTDLDKCALLIAMLEAADSSITSYFVAGDVVYDNSFFGPLLGVDDDKASACFNAFGVPAATASGITELYHYWVHAVIGGTNYYLDPSFRQYETVEGLDIASVIGYNRTQLVARVLSGATETTNSLSTLNTDNLQTDLTSFSTTLVAYIHANYPNTDITTLLGGHKVVDEEVTELPQNLPYYLGYFSATEYSSMAASYFMTLRLQYRGIDRTFKTYEIAGKRVSLFHTTGGVPELRVDGTSVATGTTTTVGTTNTLTMTITPVNYGAQTNTFNVVSGYSYVLVHNWGDVSSELMSERNRELLADQQSGLTNTSERVLGGAMHLMGMSHVLNEEYYRNLLSSISDVACVKAFEVGLIAQETGYYVDIKLNTTPAYASDGDTNRTTAFFRNQTLFSSAQEHGTLEQMQNSDNPGISTIKILHLNNDDGNATYLATTSNWSGVSGVKTQLTNYASSEISFIESYLASGYSIVLPKNGQISEDSGTWQGAGYVAYNNTRIYMLISGGYHGGYAAATGNINSQNTSFRVGASYNAPVATSIPRSLGADPVDLASGSFIVDNVDLTLGDSEPRGLNYKRFYDSDRHRASSPLGYGWTHSYDISAVKHSHSDPILGLRQPTDATAWIVSAIIIDDLFENESALRSWTIGSLATKWAMDEITDHAVTIGLGNRSMEFVELPDGTFNPPPGSTAALTYREPISYGYAGTYALSGDYDGDGETDYGVYDPSLDKFFIARSTAGQLEQSYGFGSTYPAPGDYDGDGQTDLAVIDPSTWNWYINYSSTSLSVTQQYGYAGVTNIQADYDGDGDTEIAVYHPTIFTWYVAGYTTTTFGAAGYKAVPADYDGDGKADLASINTNTWNWYIKYSSSGIIRTQQYGFAGCDAVPADYDGDGKADISVFSPTYNIQYVMTSEFTNQFTIHTATN